MRNPHVEWLRYRLVTPDTTSYENPPPVTASRNAFDLRLEGGILTATMRNHFPTVSDARKVVEAYLRAWEIKTGLEIEVGAVRFGYEEAQVVDRRPRHGTALEASVEVVAAVGGSVTARVTRRTYPEPPTEFEITVDVETLWNRYRQYTEGKEPLPGMAYFCLTILEQRYAGGARGSRTRTATAKALDVEEAILRKLGDFTSQRGDPATARKAVAIHTPLTQRERYWIEIAVRRLIRRLGELAAGKSVHKLTLADLPKLELLLRPVFEDGASSESMHAFVTHAFTDAERSAVGLDPRGRAGARGRAGH